MEDTATQQITAPLNDDQLSGGRDQLLQEDTDPLQDPLLHRSDPGVKEEDGGDDPETPDDLGGDRSLDESGGGSRPESSPDPSDDPELSLETSEPVTDTGLPDLSTLDETSDPSLSIEPDPVPVTDTELPEVGTIERPDGVLSEEVRSESGLSIRSDSFQLDVGSIDHATFLQGTAVWKAYSSGEMSPEAKAKFEGMLAKAKGLIGGDITLANTNLLSEKSNQQKREIDIESKLETDKVETAKLTEGREKATEQTRENRIAQATSEANTAHRGAEARGTERKATAKRTTEQGISSERGRVEGEKSSKRAAANRESSGIKSRAQAEKQRRIAVAEAEEKDKWWYEKAWDYVASAWERIKDSVTSMINTAWAAARRVLSEAERAITQMATAFTGWVGRQWDAFKETCAQISADVQSFISETWSSAKRKWASFKQQCAETLSSIKKEFVETMTQLASDARQAIDDGMAYMKERGTAIVNSLNETIDTAYNEVAFWWDRYEGDELEASEELFLTPEGRAEWLFKATRGLGTDVEMVHRCLRGTAAENAQLAAALQKNHGLDLKTLLTNELSGVDLAIAIDLVDGGKVSLHNRILRAIGFWGADNDAIIAMFESASSAERKEFVTSTKPEVLMVHRRMLAQMGSAALKRLIGGVDIKTGDLKQTPEALLLRIQQRGAGLGTDEKGTYDDLGAFARANPRDAREIGEALQAYFHGRSYTIPGGTPGKILRALMGELSGRDLDKAANKLLGGGADQAAKALQDESVLPEQRQKNAIDELFRPIMAVAASEAYRNGTDEDGFNTALTEHFQDCEALKAELGEAVYKALTEHPAFAQYQKQLDDVMRSELNAADYTKAAAMRDKGKQDNVDKLREEVNSMIVNNRSVMDAVIAMSAAERNELKADKVLLGKIEAGISTTDYSRLEDILGIASDVDGTDVKAANAARLAAVIVDGVSGSDNMDQVYDAMLEAHDLVDKGELAMDALRARVSAKVGRSMPRMIHSRSGSYPHPTYTPIWEALEGKRRLTSSDRINRATSGAGTDETGITETIKDLKGRDLLENWTDIAAYRAILKEIKEATDRGDMDKAKLAQIEKKQFILDVHPVKLALIRSETGGNAYTTTIKELRTKIRDASKTDAAFIEALQKDGLEIDEIYREKMEYVHSVDERRVHMDEGAFAGVLGEDGVHLVDGFTTKDEQARDAHGSYMGSLRSGMQSLERGDEGVTVDTVLEEVNKEQAAFEERLQAYKDMKSAVSSTLSLIAAAIVTIVVSVLTAGAGAAVMGPLLSAMMTGALAGAAGATAGVLVKEAVQGGSYSILEEGGPEIVIAAIAGGVGGAVGKSFEVFKPLKGLMNFADDVGTSTIGGLQKVGFPGGVSKFIGEGVKTAIPKFPESLMSNMATEPVNQMVGNGGLLRQGWDGWVEKLGPTIFANAGKDVILSLITGGLKLTRDDGSTTDQVLDNVNEADQVLRRRLRKQLTTAADQGTGKVASTSYDIAMSETPKETKKKRDEENVKKSSKHHTDVVVESDDKVKEPLVETSSETVREPLDDGRRSRVEESTVGEDGMVESLRSVTQDTSLKSTKKSPVTEDLRRTMETDNTKRRRRRRTEDDEAVMHD